MTNREIYGGEAGLNDPTARVRGVYAAHPAGTPKYNPSNTTAAAYESQARLYIEVPSEEIAAAIIDVMPSEEARAYAQAVIQVTGSDSRRVYLDFLLQNIQESTQEKVQVSEVLSDAYVAYFFGRKARMYNFQGTLINTAQDNWYDAWHILYNNLLRGTRLADIGFPVTIAYDWRRVTGYLVSSSSSLDANVETSVNFNFQVLVQTVDTLRPVNAPGPTPIEVFDPGSGAQADFALPGVVDTLRTVGMTVYDTMTAARAATVATNTASSAISEAVRAGSAIVEPSQAGDLLEFRLGDTPIQ